MMRLAMEWAGRAAWASVALGVNWPGVIWTVGVVSLLAAAEGPVRTLKVAAAQSAEKVLPLRRVGRVKWKSVFWSSVTVLLKRVKTRLWPSKVTMALAACSVMAVGTVVEVPSTSQPLVREV